MSRISQELFMEAQRNPAVTVLYRQRLDELFSQWTLEPDVVKMTVPIHTGLYTDETGTRTYQSMLVEEEACCSLDHELCGTRTYKFSTLLARFVRYFQEQFNPREARNLALESALEYAVSQHDFMTWNDAIKRFIMKGIPKRDLGEMKRLHNVIVKCEREGIECTAMDLEQACGRVLGDANRRILKEIGLEDLDYTNPMDVENVVRRNYMMEYARTAESGEYVDGLPHESNLEGFGGEYFAEAYGKLWFRLQRVCRDATIDDIDRVQCFTHDMKLPSPDGYFAYSGVLVRDQDNLDSDAILRAQAYGMTPYVGMDMRVNMARLNLESYTKDKERDVQVIDTKTGEIIQAITTANPPQAYRTLISPHIKDFLGLQHVVYGILHRISDSELEKDIERSEFLKELNPSVISVTKLINNYLGDGEVKVRSRFLIQRPVNYYKREMTIKSDTAADFWLLIPLDDLGDYLTPGWKSTDDPTRTMWIGFKIGGISEYGKVYGAMFKKLVKSRTNLADEYQQQVLNVWVKFLKEGGKLNSKVYTKEVKPKPTGTITPSDVMEFWNEECPTWQHVIRDVKPKRWACWCPTCVSLRG